MALPWAELSQAFSPLRKSYNENEKGLTTQRDGPSDFEGPPSPHNNTE